MPASEVLIVGQGLAGTVLAWTLEQAGINWRMIDAGHDAAASRVAAGIINPVTGLRWVRTWRIDACRSEAKAAYAAMARDFGVPLWREMRIRRWWRTERERRDLAAKCDRGVLAPWVQETNATHAVLGPAAQVDLPALLTATRHRWLGDGRLTEGRFDWSSRAAHGGVVIDCTGAAARQGRFAACGFAVSKGEVLRAALTGLADDTILHRGQWILPVPGADAWIGATHEPGRDDVVPTAAAREKLLASAQRLTGRSVMPTAHLVGLRLAAPDRKPVIGFHPREPRLGVFGGLGSKGVLYAPWLARQWAEHLRTGAAFDPAVDVARLGS